MELEVEQALVGLEKLLVKLGLRSLSLLQLALQLLDLSCAPELGFLALLNAIQVLPPAEQAADLLL